MTIDLKWGLPLVMPFVMLLTIRLLALVAGMEWTDNAAAGAVVFAFALGLPVGGFVAGMMEDEGVKWNVRIGK